MLVEGRIIRQGKVKVTISLCSFYITKEINKKTIDLELTPSSTLVL